MPSTKASTRQTPSKKSVTRSTRKKRAKKDYASSEDGSEAVLDSDHLDDDLPTAPKSVKRKTTARAGVKRKREQIEDLDSELEEGQTIVGVIVKAPTEGRVPPGRISQNTLNFLQDLQRPEYNDRQWFKLHDAVYRLAEKEWVAFVDKFTSTLKEVDNQIPLLPSKDLIHRIYRDVRFSDDKTPYKTNFSASFSRSGRKGPFAGYHLSIKPGGSLIAAGTWCPGKNELATLRHNIALDSSNLRSIISDPVFTKLFGVAKPEPGGGRRNIFGAEDELKVAPKGFDKNHKDIDLLKCRSIAVLHRFTDEQVLDPDFMEILRTVAGVLQPFVHCLNDLMTIPPDSDDSE